VDLQTIATILTSAGTGSGLMWWIYKLVTHAHDRRSLVGSRRFNGDLETYTSHALDAGLSDQGAYEQAWKRVCLKWGVSDLDALPTTESPMRRRREKRELTPPNEPAEDHRP
jgi:hypothetical protein